MLKSSADPLFLRHHGLKFLVITNLVALVYGLTSEYGLANILTAYLIESALIGLFAVIVLVRKLFLTGRVLGGIGAITLFSLTYFSWLAIFASLPMFLSDSFPIERLKATADHYDAMSQAIGVTPEIFFGYALSLGIAFFTTVSEFLLLYHWPVLISLTVIYGYEFLTEQPTKAALQNKSYASFITRPFARLLFLLYGPYFAGSAIYVSIYEAGPETISWTLNASLVIVITFCKFWLESVRLRRSLRRQEPPVVHMKHPLRYGAMERNDRQVDAKLEDTFTY